MKLRVILLKLCPDTRQLILSQRTPRGRHLGEVLFRAASGPREQAQDLHGCRRRVGHDALDAQRHVAQRTDGGEDAVEDLQLGREVVEERDEAEGYAEDVEDQLDLLILGFLLANLLDGRYGGDGLLDHEDGHRVGLEQVVGRTGPMAEVKVLLSRQEGVLQSPDCR